MQLANTGTEVWLAELLDSFFLPVQASSLEQIPDAAVAAIVQRALTETNKQVFLLAQGRGAIPLLRGVRAWQQAHGSHPRLRGAVLLSPNLYLETPDAGQLPRYLPIARASNLPLFVLQPELSPWRWQLEGLQSRLVEGGGGAWLRLLPGVRDRFHFRPDATAAEQAQVAALPGHIDTALRLLAWQRPPAGPAAGTALRPATGRLKKAARLAPVAPRPAPPLVLPRLEGGQQRLADLRGEVVLVNFWATWCPPCVHEMPSMERLQTHFQGRPFRILAVNMAETPATIRQFLATRVRVTFPVLLDTDGAALRRWRVVAFPTSYVIDKKGQIRYALFGGLAWDGPEVVTALGGLLEE